MISSEGTTHLSIIIPTYNESENIVSLLEHIRKSLPRSLNAEIIIVDDNSPDNTGNIVEHYSQININPAKGHHSNQNNNDLLGYSVKIVHRTEKYGLVSAILEGIKISSGEDILVMDADFSHSPEMIPKMVSELDNRDIDIVVASRYTKGGSIVGWPLRRRLISKGAIKIAKYGLPITGGVKDPMSGFFAFKRHVMEDIRIDTGGYKILLEILVKAKGARVKEIPYIFTERKAGKSKLDWSVMVDYIKAVYNLYRYGRRSGIALSWLERVKKQKTVLFLSKAGRFYTVGASGLLLNYFISILLFNSPLAKFDYIQSTIGGIAVSNISNFLLNKAWTFEDRDFSIRRTLKQYGLFAAITFGGAGIQLGMLLLLLRSGLPYEKSLIIAVAAASVSNFLLNKRWTFGERIWE